MNPNVYQCCGQSFTNKSSQQTEKMPFTHGQGNDQASNTLSLSLKRCKTPGLSNLAGWGDVNSTGPGKADGDTIRECFRPLGKCSSSVAGWVAPRPFRGFQTDLPRQRPEKMSGHGGGSIGGQRSSEKFMAETFFEGSDQCRSKARLRRHQNAARRLNLILTSIVILDDDTALAMRERVTIICLTESNRADVSRLSRRIFLPQTGLFPPLSHFLRRIPAQHLSAGQPHAARAADGEFPLHQPGQRRHEKEIRSST